MSLLPLRGVVFFVSFDVPTDHTDRTNTFTQGVAIGLDMFKPFRAFLEVTTSQPSTFNSHLSILTSQPSPLNPQLSTLNSQPSTLTFTQGVAIGLDMFKPFQGFSRGYQLSPLTSQPSTLNSHLSTLQKWNPKPIPSPNLCTLKSRSRKGCQSLRQTCP